MALLRTMFPRESFAPEPATETPAPPREGHEWLTLPQAACELGVSVSTVRRLVRKEQLESRPVPRPGGFTYLVHLPNNRHARGHGHLCASEEDEPELAAHEAQIRRLEDQVEELSGTLSRALRFQQFELAPEGGRQLAAPDPYARYRWLVRRRRWWPF